MMLLIICNWYTVVLLKLYICRMHPCWRRHSPCPAWGLVVHSSMWIHLFSVHLSPPKTSILFASISFWMPCPMLCWPAIAIFGFLLWWFYWIRGTISNGTNLIDQHVDKRNVQWSHFFNISWTLHFNEGLVTCIQCSCMGFPPTKSEIYELA